MTTNPEFMTILSITTTASYVYIVALSLFLTNNNNNNFTKSFANWNLLPLLVMSGLPPLPTFFTKLWLFGNISTQTLSFIFITMLLLNSALLYAYLNYILINKKILYYKNTTKPQKKKLFGIQIVYFSVLFFLIPEIFKIL